MDCLRLFTKEDVLDGDEKPVWAMGTSELALVQAGALSLHACVARSVGLVPGGAGLCSNPPAHAVCLPQTCCRCKARTRCTKKFSIQKFPKILVLRILQVEGWGQGVLVGGQAVPRGLFFVPRLLDMPP